MLIVEFCVTIIVGGVGWAVLPTSPETVWFLNAERETLLLKIAPKEEARFEVERTRNLS